MSSKKLLFVFSMLFLVFSFTATTVCAQEISSPPVLAKLQIEAGDYDRINTPIQFEVDLHRQVTADCLFMISDNPLQDAFPLLPVQFQGPSVLDADLSLEDEAADSDLVRRTVCFILPKLMKGETLNLTLTAKVTLYGGQQPGPHYSAWDNASEEYSELLLSDNAPVLRYMCEPLNDSTSADRERTYKVFHQVYDFAGEGLITKGAGGQYTHHRGIFFGFNKTTYGDGQRVDIWHCSGDTHQAHAGILDESVGNVLGRHVVAIDWNGVGKETFAKEQRELTVYNVPDGRMIDFASVVRTVDGPIQLDGDPQHAGFHFRAAQEVAAGDQKRTYYLRPDGKGGPGETRNWPGDAEHVNLPWNAMSFVVADQRYTALYIDRPDNPKEARFSERSYGRFGSYFEYEITEENPLKVNYRLWIQEGEMTVEEAQRLCDDFVHPPTVTVE